jgi:poly-gamma-glutamate capsule biosynthesis protein CapA/YwtB (metallophosphatase superfamily)
VTLVAGAGDVVLLRPLTHASPSLLDAWSGADVRCANLEVPLTDAVNPEPMHEGVVLRGDAALVDDLASLGLDVVGLANNHVADQGWPALHGVIESLHRRGMATIGAGESMDALWRPVALGGVAFVAATCIPPWSAGGHIAAVQPATGVDRMQAAVRAAKARSPRVVVMLHGGTPHEAVATDWQRAVARAAAEAGASVVFGCHAHVLQGVEVIAGAPVFYGLGSIVFQYQGPGWERFERDALVALVDVDDAGRARHAELAVGRMGPEGEAVKTDADHRAAVLAHLQAAGGDWGSRLALVGDRIEVGL